MGMPQEGTGFVKGPRFGHATVWTLSIRYQQQVWGQEATLMFPSTTFDGCCWKQLGINAR